MDNNIKFQQQVSIINELKKRALITDFEWYRCIQKLIDHFIEKSNK
ncbi:hypothetical protein HF295_04730 [Hujiaoplasma nucleasis]|uniref:Uncharacterized protein n=1 Tax=Hujiaoplasma nucleasis TaxID=2725268 RepID=A0A7L6N5C7_9MOLU|nr:hypothetical protein [Hujiaoplasma nucleasis]QLY40205.1 hypothetical protein HF295_04730 [Hujiaoplasma nucleasis]